jgi:hypothetical protein
MQLLPQEAKSEASHLTGYYSCAITAQCDFLKTDNHIKMKQLSEIFKLIPYSWVHLEKPTTDAQLLKNFPTLHRTSRSASQEISQHCTEPVTQLLKNFPSLSCSRISRHSVTQEFPNTSQNQSLSYSRISPHFTEPVVQLLKNFPTLHRTRRSVAEEFPNTWQNPSLSYSRFSQHFITIRRSATQEISQHFTEPVA